MIAPPPCDHRSLPSKGGRSEQHTLALARPFPYAPPNRHYGDGHACRTPGSGLYLKIKVFLNVFTPAVVSMAEASSSVRPPRRVEDCQRIKRPSASSWAARSFFGARMATRRSHSSCVPDIANDPIDKHGAASFVKSSDHDIALVGFHRDRSVPQPD